MKRRLNAYFSHGLQSQNFLLRPKFSITASDIVFSIFSRNDDLTSIFESHAEIAYYFTVKLNGNQIRKNNDWYTKHRLWLTSENQKKKETLDCQHMHWHNILSDHSRQYRSCIICNHCWLLFLKALVPRWTIVIVRLGTNALTDFVRK